MPRSDRLVRDEQQQPERIVIGAVEDFCRLLAELSGINEQLSLDVRRDITSLFMTLGAPPPHEPRQVANHFYGLLNQKLQLNAKVLDTIYAKAAHQGETFNYHAKKALAWAIDSSNPANFAAALRRYCHLPTLAGVLEPFFGGASHGETKARLLAETTKPSKLRKAHQRVVAGDVLDSAAGCLVWSLWPHQALREYFAPTHGDRVVVPDYMAGLRSLKPSIFERRRSLVARYISLPEELTEDFYSLERDRLTGWLESEYSALDNHGHLAVLIDMSGCGERKGWELAADLTLFGERFQQESLDKLYFRSKDIAAETQASVPGIDPLQARFDLAFDGFTYRDLFVLHDNQMNVRRTVILFQKNQRDETLLPCPACRSTNVEGNSYPSLGVRSWECRNVLCPERSIYNRGKRYSFKALIYQEAIETPGNEIPIESVRRWRRDVAPWQGDADVIEMLVRHYSMSGDVVVLLGGLDQPIQSLGRKFSSLEVEPRRGTARFWTSPFFARYLPRVSGQSPVVERMRELDVSSQCDSWTILHGDSAVVLQDVPSDTFDRAITSPPYFNAREYSQWSNLYCYLNEMFKLHLEVYRTLKPGAIYAFNIFDYFDNERTITFSAMGDKRIALSALFVDLFRRIGFAVCGNLVWDKGDVEGKRSFNRGNYSPFYQAPLNCWEHVLLFQKPAADDQAATAVSNRVLRIKPVYKMVRGENRHGHSAPYPIELPKAIAADLPKGALVLDPFGGSGTTARAALDLDLRAALVECDLNYCALSEKLTKDHEIDLARQRVLPTLF